MDLPSIRFFYSVFSAFYSSNIGFLACGETVTSSVNFHSWLNIEMSQSDVEMFIAGRGTKVERKKEGRKSREEASERKSLANLKL